MSYGAVEYNNKINELPLLGVNSTSDTCLVRLESSGFRSLQGFELRNNGSGSVTFTLKKRGSSTAVTTENIDALRIGSTDRYRGSVANRRLTAGTVHIEDDNVTTVQELDDTNGDGILYQTAGPTGPTYPIAVGTVDYTEGTVDFTWLNTVTANVTADYTHTNWSDFSSSITFSIAAGGGRYRYDIYPANAANYIAGIKDESEVGFFAKLNADQSETNLHMFYTTFGPDENVTMPFRKGEINDYPYHNA
jgi:hypothetical protein